jgi:hypothetical protein
MKKHFEIAEVGDKYQVQKFYFFPDGSRNVFEAGRAHSTYAAAVAFGAKWASKECPLFFDGYEVTGPENAAGALGWAKYMDGEQLPETVERGRIGWLSARCAEMDATPAREEYEEMQPAGVFFHATYR